MANISISDLYPSEIESLLDTDDKGEGLLKTSINRALEVRGAIGTSYLQKPIVEFPPHTIGIIAQPNYSNNITLA